MKGYKRRLLRDVQVRDHAEHGSRRALAVAVDQAHPVASHGQELREVYRHGRLADAALEVLHGNDRHRIAWLPPRAGAEDLAHMVDLGQGVADAAAGHRPVYPGQTAVLLRLTDGGRGTPDHLRRAGDWKAWWTVILRIRQALLAQGGQHVERTVVEFRDGFAARQSRRGSKATRA